MKGHSRRRADLREILAGQHRVLPDNRADDDDIAGGHRIDLVGPGDVDDLDDLLRGVGIGIDDEIGADCLPEMLARSSSQLAVLESHYGLACSHVLREQCGDEIHLVVLGHASEELGSVGPGLAEDRRGHAVAHDRLHVEVVAEGSGDDLVLLDHHHVVVLGAETLREIPTHFSGTDDDYMHGLKDAP